MCPVRALDANSHRASMRRRADQLLVCYAPPKRGLPATKQTLSRWIVDTINTACESSQFPLPMGVRAHSRSVAASKASLAGVQIQDICNTAGRSTPLKFVRFYSLEMRATLFRPLTLDVLRKDTLWAGTSVSMGISSPMSSQSQLEVLKRNISRLRM